MIRPLIIGAGPGGLAAALALRVAGMKASVFEKADGARRAGSGLTLWPNALAALDAMGAGKAVRAVSQPLDGIAIRAWNGKVLSTTPGELLERECGGTGATVHRAELVGVLRELVGRDTIQMGTRCIGYREGDEVTALFADGSVANGDLLIGADGLRSVVAEQLFGTLELRFAGYCVWRGIAAIELSNRVGVMSMGPGAQFGMFPLTERRVYWFAAHRVSEGVVRRDAEHKRGLLARFGGWHPPIPTLIEATEDDAILPTDIYNRTPLPHWSSGRITLLGDAAHPSEPTLGQGACQALEDAAVLGECLRSAETLPEAWRVYEQRRIPRTNAITSQARRMGRLGQWERWPLPWLRDCLIRRTPAWMQLRQLRWLWNFALGLAVSP